MNCTWCRKRITDHYQTLEIRNRHTDQITGYVRAHYPTCAHAYIDQINTNPSYNIYFHGHRPRDIRLEYNTLIEDPFDANDTN